MKIVIPLFLFGLAGCMHTPPSAPDFGQCYRDTFSAQADRTRSTAAHAAYPLTGIEATEIRLPVQETASDKEAASPDAAESLWVE